MAALNDILKWFKKGLKPTEEQFAQAWSSFRHKDNKVPISDVENLDQQLNDKLGTNHESSKTAHDQFLLKKDGSNLDDQGIYALKNILEISPKYNNNNNSADDVISLCDYASGISINYRETDRYYDGSKMNDALVDGVVYIKNRDRFYVQTFDGQNNFIFKKSIEEFRNISSKEILLLKMQIYKGIQLLGYYTPGDFPNPINYYLCNDEDEDEDNGGSIIIVDSFEKFKTDDIKSNPYPEYFGAKKDVPGFDNSSIINKLYAKYNEIKLNAGIYYISSPIYINNKIKSSITGKGRRISVIKANPDFRVVNSGSGKTDNRYDFENAMILVRRGDKSSSDNISIDPLDNVTINGISVDGSVVVPVGVEMWAMFSTVKDVEITGTLTDAFVFRRGWNNAIDDLYCYYNEGRGVVLESECNSFNIGKIVVAHTKKNGFRICQGHAITIGQVSVESCEEDGILIEDRLFPELESKGADVSAISAVTINSAYLEHNGLNPYFANIKIIGHVAVDSISIKSIYINLGNARPIHLDGTLRKFISVDYIGVYANNNKSYIGFINGQMLGDLANITINGMSETDFDFLNDYESKQISFVKNSKSGSKSFNGINLRKNKGNQRARGDIEYDDKLITYYVADATNADGGVKLNCYNEFSIELNSVIFTFIITNKIVYLYINGTADFDYENDLNLPLPNYLKTMAARFGRESLFSDSNTSIETRDYNSIFVKLKKGISLNLKLMYPIL